MDGNGVRLQTCRMSIETWWPKLRPVTRDWLISNNGDVVPRPIIEEIAAAGGPPESDGWWVSDDDLNGVCMPDEAVDWIEDVANDEPSTREGH